MSRSKLLGTIICISGFQAIASAAEMRPVDLNQNAALRYYRAIAVMAEGGGVRGTDGWELVSEWGTPEADERASEIIAGSRPLLELVHEGARIRDCQWGLDEIDFETLLPHLQLMRHLGRLGCFRAHYRFTDGYINGGVADTTAVLALARHVGQDPTLIGRLVSIAVQNIGIDVLATNLDRLSLRQLTDLEVELDRLESIADLPYAQYVETERRTVVDGMLRAIAERRSEQVKHLIADGDDESIVRKIEDMTDSQLIEAIRQTVPLYTAAARAVDLPIGEILPAVDATDKEAEESGNVVAAAAFPSFGAIYRAILAGQGRFLMLRAAVAHRLQGTDGLARFKDPMTGEPFELRELDGGIELRSEQIRRGDKPLTLRVGLPQAD